MKTRCITLFICCLGLSPAFGHHFKGLPHFSYFENYPQVPQDEFLAQAGNYECSLCGECLTVCPGNCLHVGLPIRSKTTAQTGDTA